VQDLHFADICSGLGSV